MRKLIFVGAALILSTAANAMTGPVCFPTKGPKPGTLRGDMNVAVPPTTCPSGVMVLHGGKNVPVPGGGEVVVAQRTCECASGGLSRR